MAGTAARVARDREPADIFHTDVPARLDRLPWSRFHWLVIAALGITWILDGLEVTLVGSLSGAIADPSALNLTSSQIGLAGSAYIAGAVLGALFFGDLTDRLGRKKLFSVTVGVYAVATVATGFAWDFWSFAACRFLTGAGIGGEYSAINSAIQELIPARRRGLTDLTLNGSFWVGAAIGALGSLVVLDPAIVPPEYGWRSAFVIGGILAIVVITLRKFLPESPRWLMTHGRPEEAERIVHEIERRVEHQHGVRLVDVPAPTIGLRKHGHLNLIQAVRILFGRYPKRAVLGLSLMGAQAFCYNAIFFTYALILAKFYNVPSGEIGWFMLPFAVGNFLGPLVLGHFFDSVGRKTMITATYALAGGLMLVVGWMFEQNMLGPVGQTAMWLVIFFFASAAASSAYMTVAEAFPLELRAIAIAVFYSFGTGLGGMIGPALFGALIDTGSRQEIFWGYALGGILMIGAALVELRFGIAAERRSLEDVCQPLSSQAE
ncbi:MAG TPA: MFS transporter [Alphaproteobacteria bacterium]